ncbi:uncharacterized protein LOC103312511 [Tribolium castaneum]|uniref:uncharacterized protein LOC103312511 n=1 Tax=Tribolium castaneum TaxID=7070 RepID=UPI00077DC8B4|nr:PREDICTED: uncharacterized protein LOC103312511 [Tribolium castaneum]|eukprot:XP_015834220.1 PREDICTED: uncharacterized protein LOC103312511 [Tribolium castaneum]
MGAVLGGFWARLAEFPIKRKPICFHLQKNFTSTGEEIIDESEAQTDAYDELQNAFIKKLEETRRKNENWLRETFPYWDQLVVDNLNNTFILLVSDSRNGMMDFQHFCWFLDSLGDATSSDLREQKFAKYDSNEDGFVNFDEFLLLVYNYNPADEMDGLRGIAKICYEMSEQISHVNHLTVGEQLQYGLF